MRVAEHRAVGIESVELVADIEVVAVSGIVVVEFFVGAVGFAVFPGVALAVPDTVAVFCAPAFSSFSSFGKRKCQLSGQ